MNEWVCIVCIVVMIFIATGLFASALPCQRLVCGASHVNPVYRTERDD